MKEYYLKKLSGQELGYRSGIPGGGGRYIYISKDCLEFFPPLSEITLNDSILIPIIPPFSKEKVYSKFVYHNDKKILENGTRDEYRIYFNRSTDPDRSYYQINDILVFEKHEENIDGDILPTYVLNRFNEASPLYEQLDNIISESKIRGGHAIYNGDFGFEDKINEEPEKLNVIIPEEIKKEVNEKMSSGEAEMGAHLFNSISFRDFVLNSYSYKCAITKKSIVWKNLNNLEAAHIRPKAHSGTFLPCNGIALSRDMHWAFDKGFISIDDNYKIMVHKDITSQLLKELEGQQISLPSEEFFKPNKEYLRYHREKVFGLFLYSGSIRAV